MKVQLIIFVICRHDVSQTYGRNETNETKHNKQDQLIYF